MVGRGKVEKEGASGFLVLGFTGRTGHCNPLLYLLHNVIAAI